MLFFIDMTCIPFPGPGINNPMSDSLFYEMLGARGHSKTSQTAHIESAFTSFKSSYKKQYSSKAEEMLKRFNFHHNFRCSNFVAAMLYIFKSGLRSSAESNVMFIRMPL